MIAMFDSKRNQSWLLPAVLLLALGIPFLANGEFKMPPRPDSSDGNNLLSEDAFTAPEPTSVAAEVNDARPVDAAIAAAERFFALTDAGEFRESWHEMHSMARKLISPEAWEALCTTKGLALARDGATAVVSREIASLDYLPALPHGLGDGISIRYDIRLNNGKRFLIDVLFAKDHDGQWRFARGDEVDSQRASPTKSLLPIQASSQTTSCSDEALDPSHSRRYPVDDAVEAAKRYTALTDAGECSRIAEDLHSNVRKLMSADLMRALCEQRAAKLRLFGQIISRDVFAIDYLPKLPLELGSGVVVDLKVVLRTAGAPSHRTLSEKIWLAEDSDHRWKMVRFEGELE